MSRKKRKKQKPLVQLVLPTRSQGNQSEVARLMAQITAEYQSAQWGLSGLTYGISQHEFITARMENMERAREQLVQLVGPDESTRLVVEQLDKGGDDA